MNLDDDDFFSPVRNITSDSDSSVDFENSSNITSSEIVTFSKTSQKKHVLKHNKTKGGKERDQLESCSSESSFALKPEEEHIYTPPSKRSSAKLRRDTKTQSQDFNQVKIEKEKYSKDNIKKERSSESSECHVKKQDYQLCKAMADCETTKSNIKQNYGKKGVSRPTSLSLSRKEGSKCSTTKELKKEKNVTERSKNICNLGIQISNAKHSEKKLMDNSLEDRGRNSEVSGEKSTDSNSFKSFNYSSSTTKSDTSNKKSGLDQNVEDSKSISNRPVNSPFEISVEKIVHDRISSECDAIRQNMYMQQMSFYRELNKVNDEMKRQHLEDTERMLTIIEQLAQMNFSLKSVS